MRLVITDTDLKGVATPTTVSFLQGHQATLSASDGDLSREEKLLELLPRAIAR